MYGGYGSSMYGGGGSIYGGGGMYGQSRQAEAEFFGPVQVSEEKKDASKRISEMKDVHTYFLDSLHSYGDNVFLMFKRVIQGLAHLHRAVRDGRVSPVVARAATLFAIALTASCLAATGRIVMRRRRRALVWDRLFDPHPMLPPLAFMPRASL